MRQRWLSLKVLDENSRLLKGVKRKQSVMISIPKKIVPLAVCRNRIRRLIREAIRTEKIPKRSKICNLFRINKVPGNLSLNQVKDAVHSVLGEYCDS